MGQEIDNSFSNTSELDDNIGEGTPDLLRNAGLNLASATSAPSPVPGLADTPSVVSQMASTVAPILVADLTLDEDKDDGIDPDEYKVPDKATPNVKLSGLQQHQALPKGLVNIGMNPGIIIPSKQTQLAGFYVEDPSVLCTQFPQYKRVVQKVGQ